MAEIQDTPEQIVADAAAQTPVPSIPTSSLPPATVSQPAPEPSAEPTYNPNNVNVYNPEGDLVSIPKSQLNAATAQGYEQAAPEDVRKHFLDEKYGTTGQQALTALEGAAEGTIPGAAPLVERALGVKGIEERKEANPGVHGVFETGALLNPYSPIGKLMGAAGHAAAAAIPGANALAKIGSTGAKWAAEGAILQSGSEVSRLISDPNLSTQSIQTAITDVGLSGIAMGALGAGIGSVNPLWKAAGGAKVSEFLRSIAERVGGIEGQVPNAMDEVIQKTGMNIAPEVRAPLIGGDFEKQAFNTLNQTDSTAAGRKLQEINNNFRSDAGKSIAGAFGKTLEELPAKGDFNKAEAGKALGKALSEEYEQQMQPLSKAYEDMREKYGKIELDPGVGEKVSSPELKKAQQKAFDTLDTLSREAAELQASGKTEAALAAAEKAKAAQVELTDIEAKMQTPGTVDSIVHDVGMLAQAQGWTASPSSEIMREVGRVIKEVPNLKTVGDLGNYVRAIGANMQSDPLNREMMRAGSMIKEVLKKAESEMIERTVGKTEGDAARLAFQEARTAYAAQSKLREALDSRVHAGGSTSGFAKSLSVMAHTDGETLLRRLSGINDADLLTVLSQSYPKAAEALREAHITELLSKSYDGKSINPTSFLTNLQKLSPQLKEFIGSPQTLERVSAIGEILKEFDSIPKNYSGSARLLDKLGSGFPGTVVGLVTMIAGHNPATAVIMGALTKALSKDAPDAIKLGLLKFLGSSQPIESEGFKAMVDYIHATTKGAALVSKATKNLFRAGAEVLPQSYLPSESDRKKLDKQVSALRVDPKPLLEAGGKTSHYLPEHGQAIAQTAASAINYLNSVKPGEKQNSPLDTKIPPSPMQKAQYDNALNIAQQPLVIMDKIQKGTLTSLDLIHLKNLYPALYTSLQAKLTDNLAEALDKGHTIPYRTRLGLSLFMAQPMDSTMTPMAIQSAQPAPKQDQPQQQNGKPPAQSSMKGINKMPATYQTQSQALAARRQRQD